MHFFFKIKYNRNLIYYIKNINHVDFKQALSSVPLKKYKDKLAFYILRIQFKPC